MVFYIFRKTYFCFKKTPNIFKGTTGGVTAHVNGFHHVPKLVVVVDVAKKRGTAGVKERLRLDVVHRAALAKRYGGV